VEIIVNKWHNQHMKKSNVAILGIILLSFAIGIYFFPLLPDQLASHWNKKGEVDGYMGKFWGVFLMPIISVVLYLMFLIMPRIDPLKENVQKFRKYFDGFIIGIMLFLLYIYVLTIAWNYGWRFNLVQYMSPALGVLFYLCGVLTKHSKPNWFIGIRTPWTLMNEKVWEKTHHLGGKLFKVAGVISIFGAVFPGYAFWLILIPALIAGIYPVIYSYLEYKKLIASKD